MLFRSIHISSGLRNLKACKKISGKTKLVGVTTLTSIDSLSLKQIGFDKKIRNLVIHQAKLANKAKLDAIVCSAKEVNIVKKVFKKEIITTITNMKTGEVYKDDIEWKAKGIPESDIRKDVRVIMPSLDLFGETK